MSGHGINYRVLWFQGDIEEPDEYTPGRYFSLDELRVMRRPDTRAPRLRLLLAPELADDSGLTGDDWNDAPANCNAGPPYESTYPTGAVMLELCVGDLLQIAVTPMALLAPPLSPQ